MALAASAASSGGVGVHGDSMSDKRDMLKEKIKQAQEELIKLKKSHQGAVCDITQHHNKASIALGTIKDAALQAAETYEREYQRRITEWISKMEDLLKNVLGSNTDGHTSEDLVSTAITDLESFEQNLATLLQKSVTVPHIKFLGNEEFLFTAVNGRNLSYFGGIVLDSTVLACDLTLHGHPDPDIHSYRLRIDVPDNTTDYNHLSAKIKCEAFQRATGSSVTKSAVWFGDHFEFTIGFTQYLPFTVGVFLMDQHVTGSPLDFDPRVDFSDSFLDIVVEQTFEDDLYMDVVMSPSQRCNETQDPEIEEALREINGTRHANNNIYNTNNNTNTNNTNANNININNNNEINSAPKMPLQTYTKGGFKTEFKTESDLQRVPTANNFRQRIKITHMPSLSVTISNDRKSVASIRVPTATSTPHRNNNPNNNNNNGVMGEAETIVVTENSCLRNIAVKSPQFSKVDGHIVFAITIDEPYNWDRPVGVLLHSSGIIFVSDTFNNRMLRLNSEGGPIDILGSSNHIHRPSSLVELEDGSVAVVCYNRIALFDAEGNCVREYGRNLLQKPYGLCVSSSGKMMTVDTAQPGTLVIVTFRPGPCEEVLKTTVSLRLSTNQHGFSKPRFIASHNDKLYVVDLGLNCVYEINYMTGALLNTFGRSGKEPGCFNDPSGIACDLDGNIYVADSRNHRIQVFSPCRKLICIINFNHPLNRPSGICLTRQDDLFVLNYWDNSLAKYHLTYRS